MSTDNLEVTAPPSRWTPILTWVLGFFVAEAVGVASASAAEGGGFSNIVGGALGGVLTVAVRLAVLAYTAKVSGLGLADAAYRPLPKGAKEVGVILASGAVAASSTIVVSAGLPGSLHLQLLDIPYFMRQGALWAFPIQLAYYLSEIVLMTFTYILANKAWTA